MRTNSIVDNIFDYSQFRRIDVAFKVKARETIVDDLKPPYHGDAMGVNYILITFLTKTGELERIDVGLSALDMDDNNNYQIGVGSLTVHSIRCNIRLPPWLMAIAKSSALKYKRLRISQLHA